MISPFVRVTLPLAALNFINQASRTVMAVIGPVLALEFGLSASELGLMAACMFAAYAVVQLPAGVALDRVGPRTVQAALGVLAAAGFAVFALADGLAGFILARVILGVGIAAGLMAIIKGNAQWFAPAKVAHMTGIGVALSALGAVASTTPVEAVLPAIGWRGVLWLLCGLSAASAIWIYLSVPDKPAAGQRPGLAAELAVLGRILRAARFWRYAPAVAMLSTLNFAYLGLWAGPWLRDVAGYDGVARAQTLLFYTLAMLVGAIVIGSASSWAHARRLPPFLIAAICTVGLIGAQVGLALQPAGALAVNLLWILFAFSTAGSVPGYVAVGQMFPAGEMGRVATAVNALTLGAAFLLQAAVGWILDLWPRSASGGWDPQGYSAALVLSAALQFVLLLLMRPSSR